MGTTIRQLVERLEQAGLQLAVTAQRAIAAEERANKAEASLKRLQAEILAKTMMKKLVPRVA